MTATVLKHRIGQRRAWAVWGAAVAVYMLAVFHRTSLSVAGITAAERFHITAAQLATFTMVQLLVYAGMQIPVGVLLDRVGSKRMLTIGLILMTVGQLGFAVASSYSLGLMTRVLVGIGDSMTFVSVLRLVGLWFPAAKSPIVTQLTGLLGQVGAIAAAIPMSHALAALGWTKSFGAAALLGVVLGVVLYVVVIDSPYADSDEQVKDVRLADVALSVRYCWAQPGTRLGMWTHFTGTFSANVMGLLWGFPFLVQGQGLSTSTAGVLLTAMTVSAMVSGPVVGTLVARHPFHRSTLVLAAVSAIVASWTAVLVWPGAAPVWLLLVMLLVTGIGGPSSMVGFDFARSFNPVGRLGSANGLVIIGGFLATLLTIVGIGLMLDALTPGTSTHYSHGAFTAAMSLQYVVWAIGLTQILRYRRRTRRGLLQQDPEAYTAMRRGDPAAVTAL
ncbi:MAG: MFS transporter [Nocardioidaceae bacterium]